LWARLSVFAGGFELDAAEGLCADDRLAASDVLELLAPLADKSILIAEHLHGGVRYRLPETLRQYGHERLQESGEYTVLRRRHRDWYEQLAVRADTGWLSPHMTEWAARLFREHANVQAAQDFCQAEPGEAEAGLRIAMHVWLFTTPTGGISARASTGSARRWPRRPSPPSGGRRGCCSPVSWLPGAATATPLGRCWRRVPGSPGS
jgi:non-specific serine/threonine protein kinase